MTTTNGVLGEWLQITLAAPIVVAAVKFRNWTTTSNWQKYWAEDWTLFGSNDGGSTWATAFAASGVPVAPQNQDFLTVPTPGVATAYQTYRMVVTQLKVGFNSSCFLLSEMELVSLPSPLSLTVNTVVQDTGKDVFGCLYDIEPTVKRMTANAGQCYKIGNSFGIGAAWMHLQSTHTAGALTPDLGTPFTNTGSMQYTVNVGGLYKVDCSMCTAPANQDNLTLTIALNVNGATSPFKCLSKKVKTRFTTQAFQGILQLNGGDVIYLEMCADATDQIDFQTPIMTVFRLRQNT
jgi:hypothetical protein